MAAPAWAHVSVTPAEAPAGVEQRYAIAVPGEKPISTTRVEVQLPAELRGLSVEARPGWSATTQTGGDGRILGATWSGGTIASGEAVEFAIVARNPDGAASLAWKVIQTYQDGSEVHWNGPPSGELPAATSRVLAAGGGPHASALAAVAIVIIAIVAVALARARRVRCIVGAIAMAATVTGASATVHAHALLDRAEPAPGSVAPDDRPPSRLALQFTEAVSAGPRAVAVLDTHQRRVGPLAPRLASPSRVEVDLPALAPGACAVRWRVTSRDSHVVGGTYWFVVGFAAAPPPTVALRGTGAPPVPWLEVIARWLALIAVLGLSGIVLAAWIVAPRATAYVPPAVVGGPMVPALLGVALIVAELLRAASQAAGVAELPLPAALDRATVREVLVDSRFAVWWWMRVAVGLVLAARLTAHARARRAAPAAAPLDGRTPADTPLLSALLLVATAAAGHAVAAWLPLAADVVHLGAAALWLGGLAYVGCGLAHGAHDPRGRTRFLVDVVPRLSAAALASVPVLVVTGAVNAYAQVGSLALLVRSGYGEALLLKLSLLVPWLAVAAVNRLLLRPRVATAGALFTSLVRAEIVFGVAVLLVVGVLGSLPPPGARALPAPTDVARQAGPLRVSLEVDPTWVGVSRFRVRLADATGSPPPDVRRVVLTFTMDGMNMGRTHVTLAPRRDGTWETRGFYVGMPGIAQIGVAITREDAPDAGAVFRVEIPDVNAAQLAGLRASAGVSALALFGAITGVCLTLAVVAAERDARRRLVPAAVAAIVVLGVGPVVVDGIVRARAAGATSPPPWRTPAASCGGARSTAASARSATAPRETATARRRPPCCHRRRT